MARKIFISYNYNDRETSNTVKSMLQSSGGLIQGKFNFVEGDVSYQGDAAIDQKIKTTMDGCDAALFIVGNNNHNSPWINREAQLAISKGLKIVLTQLPRTRGGVPHELTKSNYPNASWNSQDISRYLN